MGIFTVDGNIGCGKSTILEYIHTKYGCPVDLEPVKKWQPFLNEMYRDGKNAFEFQVRVWLDRCWIQQRPNQAHLVMERSPYFQYSVFIPANYENNKLNQREYETLIEMYQHSFQMWNPAFYIYLRSNPEKCINRIQKRHRQSEDQISLDYITKLHDLHENAYLWAMAQGVPVVCIDVETKSIEQLGEEVYLALKAVGY